MAKVLSLMMGLVRDDPDGEVRANALKAAAAAAQPPFRVLPRARRLVNMCLKSFSDADARVRLEAVLGCQSILASTMAAEAREDTWDGCEESLFMEAGGRVTAMIDEEYDDFNVDLQDHPSMTSLSSGETFSGEKEDLGEFWMEDEGMWWGKAGEGFAGVERR